MKHPESYDSTPEIRERMSKVHLKNGKAEQILAKRLWHLGYRYRKNVKKLLGSPDIVMRKYHIAIFVDGEFWHGKDWSTRRDKLKSNREYWIQKIEENIRRDEHVTDTLRQQGWMVLRFWEKDVLRRTDDCVKMVVDLCALSNDDCFDDEERWMISE